MEIIGNSDFNLQDFAADAGTQLGPQGFFPAFTKRRVALGYDPAQTFDESALVLVESVREPIPFLPGDPNDAICPSTLRQRLGKQNLDVRKIRRLPKGMQYPQQVMAVREMVNAAARIGKRAEVVIDVTGIGLPIAQMMPAQNLYPTKILITSGNTVPPMKNGAYHVPKKILVGLIDAHLNNDEIILPEIGATKNPQDDLEIAELDKQMSNFVAGFNVNGSASYAAAGSGKDDLVLALSYAVWVLSDRRGRSHYSVRQFII